MSESQQNNSGGAAGRSAGERFGKAHHILLYFVTGVVVVWLLSGFYKVNMDEKAIVERLGQYIAAPSGRAIPVGQGLHWHLPWPIERVHVISVKQRMTMGVKTFNVSPTEYEDFKQAYLRDSRNPQTDQKIFEMLFNPYLISADKSVLHMEATVQFEVNDPEQWLMAVSHEYQEKYDPSAKNDLRNKLFQKTIERAIIAQCSRLTFADLLLASRESLPGSVQNFVEKGMKIRTRNPKEAGMTEDIDLGIAIKAVQVKLRPPDAVMAAYNKVLAKLAEGDSKRSAASADATTMVNTAVGETQTLELDARRYATKTVQAAKGEKARFELALKQYEVSPDIARWNLFAEAATAVTGAAKRIFVVQPGQELWIGVDPPVPAAQP
jgi:modulator of FtsH protease HflK